MRKSITGLSAFAFLMAAAPALAQDDGGIGPVAIHGSAGLVSDYRFRGFSQTSQDPAVQGGVTVATTSGVYAGVWGSSVNFPNSNLGSEIDLFAGYTTKIAEGVTLDAGLLYYLYPKHKALTGRVATDFFEPYVNLTGAIGPLSLKVGANYAWDQDALGGNSAIYLHAEPSYALSGTPFGVNGHLGYARSDSFLGGVNGKVWDWSLGATATYKKLTFGIAYVDTDEPSVIRGSDPAVIFSLTAAF
ncbi:MAG TPA: TorF family putative porin [Sphingobium sp.]|nr:TorF family putative porin [Sphingobium sp.]